MSAWRICSILLLLLAPLTTGCSGEPNTESNGDGTGGEAQPKFTLLLNWYPEAEHGGFYAALVHGYYEEAGLEVEIVPGGREQPVIPQVDRGQYTFGVANGDRVLLGRAAGADVVALMAPLQQSPRCVMVHADSGIESFDDLAKARNLKLATGGGGLWRAFLEKKYDLSNVNFVPDPSVQRFLADPNFAMQAYVFSEPFVAESEGEKPRNLMVSELGFSPYTSCLIATGTTIEDDPELVAKFVRASVRGWVKYLEDPAETNAHIDEQNPQMSPEALAFGAEAMQPLCYDDGTTAENCSRMTSERWQTLVSQLEELGELEPGAVKPKDAFNAEFLEAEPATD